jgi:hypothetical protein
VPLRIFVHRGEEVTAGCRKLRNEGLHDLYSSSGIIGVIKYIFRTGHVACMRNVCRVLVYEPEGNKNLLNDKDVYWILILKCLVIGYKGLHWINLV